ncbi:MAG: phage holin family protein, partial [Chloroflexales bacterium]|nr:phage holin family protein [Chloroflexales bacterium]
MADAYSRPERQELPGNVAGARASDTGNDSIAGLLGGVIADAQQLVRREVDLAKQEVLIEVDKVKQGAISLGIGGGVLALGGIMLLLMLVHGLNEWFGLPMWASYLIVGGVLAIVGAVLLFTGLNRLKQVDPVPHETISEVRKDMSAVSSAAQEVRKDVEDVTSAVKR